MKARYRLFRRGIRGGAFYCVDTNTGNLNIARAYLAGADSGFTIRTWKNALDALIETKQGKTRDRWITAGKDKACAALLNRIIAETQPEHLLAALKAGTVSTNVHLRKLHNFALSMGWLPWPIIPKRQWPEIKFKPKRAITFDEHQRILAQEQNPEYRAYYESLWHLGGAQSDVANLRAEDIDWHDRTIAYARKKTGSNVIIHFGEAVEEILKSLPQVGFLFPSIQSSRETDRATYFKRRCRLRGVSGVTLHSYRYAWAERAKTAGYPERFAQVRQCIGRMQSEP